MKNSALESGLLKIILYQLGLKGSARSGLRALPVKEGSALGEVTTLFLGPFGFGVDVFTGTKHFYYSARLPVKCFLTVGSYL